ncbi:hypothetical protein [Frigoriglobus tundricola]|uniref:hypothetical protein n=1 Tax=Frigoriglobus tundricola TaxID=2774151 RepID=UPI001D09487B|nr:hypothetical protein [Frigoriglobus tundricola]
MTEAQWLSHSDPLTMLPFLKKTASDRKLRLFACGCARRIWHMLSDERSRTAVETAERHADGRADNEQLARACEDAFEANRDIRSTEPQSDAADMAACVACDAAWPNEDMRTSPTGDEYSGVVDAAQCTASAAEYAAHGAKREPRRERKVEEQALANYVRDIFGNPFRPVTFSADWRTDTTVSLARQMYDTRDFSAMPILADALQDTGCDSAEILAHSRGPGPHVCGCWVVDLVLGKE